MINIELLSGNDLFIIWTLASAPLPISVIASEIINTDTVNKRRIIISTLLVHIVFVGIALFFI